MFKGRTESVVVFFLIFNFMSQKLWAVPTALSATKEKPAEEDADPSSPAGAEEEDTTDPSLPFASGRSFGEEFENDMRTLTSEVPNQDLLTCGFPGFPVFDPACLVERFSDLSPAARVIPIPLQPLLRFPPPGLILTAPVVALPAFIRNQTNNPQSLAPRDARYLWTAVLDLDGTMVYAIIGGAVHLRPFSRALLRALAEDPEVEVLVWTAGVGSFAIRSLVALAGSESRDLRVDHFIHRGSWFNPYQVRKNLGFINRTNAVLVDDTLEVVENSGPFAIRVPEYRGDSSDGVLEHVMKIFAELKISLAADTETLPRHFLQSFLARSEAMRESGLAYYPPPEI